MSTAMLIGDLAVLYTEVAARPQSYLMPAEAGHRPFPIEGFATWFAFGNHLFRLAIDTGIAAVATPAPAAVANLREVVTSTDEGQLLRELLDALYKSFSSIGYEYGYFYGGDSWTKLCWFRSGLVFLAEFAGVTLNFEDIEDYMARYGGELWEEVTPPAGMPPSHWWWFGPEP